MDHVLVVGGGIIPEDDAHFLKEKGVSAIFGPGTSVKKVADYIRSHVKR